MSNYMNILKKNKRSFVVPAFIGIGIGALLGLVAYVKDWF